jgi:hypothetical protein
MTGWFGGSNPSLATCRRHVNTRFSRRRDYHGAVAKRVTAAALYAEDAQVQVLPAPRREIADDE